MDRLLLLADDSLWTLLRRIAQLRPGMCLFIILFLVFFMLPLTVCFFQGIFRSAGEERRQRLNALKRKWAKRHAIP